MTPEEVRKIEELIHRLLRALDENERLRQELLDANLEISYLQRKVDALSDDSREAQRTGRREFFVQGLTFVAMVLTIAAEGPRIAAPSNDQSEAEVFAAECRSLIEAMRVERSNDIDVTAGASVGVSAVAHGTAYPATVEIKANVPDPTVLVVDET